MRLKFTLHCQYRITERSLNVEQVKQAILNPDKKHDAGGGALKVWKRFGTKQIVVVYSKDGFRDRKDYFVITAYYL